MRRDDSPDAPLTAIDVACFKWGTRYPSEQVNRLRGMLRRHLGVPMALHCVTDDPRGLHPEVVVHDIAQFAVEGWDMGHGLKLSSFSRGFLGLDGRHVVIIDIDMVILGDMSFVLDRPGEDFIITPGRNQYAGTRGHSALYRLRVGSHPRVWESLVADPGAAIAAYQHHLGAPGQLSEQRWLDSCFPEMAFFPEGVVAYYRQDCGALGRWLFGRLGRRLGLTTAFWGTAEPPPGTRVVSFAGRVDPVQVATRHHQEWRRAPFVAEHWRE